MRGFLLKILTGLGVFALVLLGLLFYARQGIDFEPPQFSDSLGYDSSFIALYERELQISNDYLPDILSSLTGYRPATNPLLLRETYNEALVSLSDRARERSEQVVAQHEIEYENLFQIPIAEETLSSYLNRTERPLTMELFALLDYELSHIVALEKIAHDVARPMQVDLAVNSPVATPQSPSYPSLFAARSALATLLLSEFVTETEREAIRSGVRDAQERTEIVGISNLFDLRYANALAREFYRVVMENESDLREFIAVVREREWENSTASVLEYDASALPDLTFGEGRVEREGIQVTFYNQMQNIGEAPAPTTTILHLELDRFADGVADEIVMIPWGWVDSNNSIEVGYTRTNRWEGTHQFRFVANPNFGFAESQHANNFGPWVQF